METTSFPPEVTNLQQLCIPANTKKLLKLSKHLAKSPRKDIKKAFSLLSYCLSVDVEERQSNYDLYFKVLEEWSEKLISSSRFEDALKLFEVAQDIYNNSPDLNYLLADTLFRVDRTRLAWEYALKAHKTCWRDPKCWRLVSELTNCLVDRWHFPMINDKIRNSAYKKAIENAIQNGHSTVLDIGSGSALLSIYAQRAGASKIYACDVDEFLCELAEDVVKTNLENYTDIKIVNCHSTNINIPSDILSKVSLVVTETFDAGLFGEHILETLKHAWENLLHPSKSIVLPMRAEIFISLLDCPYVARQSNATSDFYTPQIYNFSVDMKEPYLSEKVKTLPGSYSLLTNWIKVLNINFNSPEEIDLLISGELNEMIEIEILEDGIFSGIILAFKLHVDENNIIETFPDSNTCWENAIYPVELSDCVKKGQNVILKMTFDKVLRFNLETKTPSITLKVDSFLLKCVNSGSYREFYKNQAIIVNSMDHISYRLLDLCPFPEGGLQLLSLVKNSKLIVTHSIIPSIMDNSDVCCKNLEIINEEVDVIFYWPFSNEGTLKDNLIEEVSFLRCLLPSDRLDCFIPNNLEVHMLGIESAAISSITRTDDQFTCGVKVSSACDFVKTLHHLDIAVEGYQYKPVTPVIKVGKLNFLKNCQWEYESSCATSNCDFLTVGSETKESSRVVKAVASGRLIGFIYWFEVNGVPENESILKQECNTKQSDCSSPWSSVTEEISFCSLSRDSPINQSILLLQEPIDVITDQEIHFQFCASDSQFFVYVHT